jgi:hypothetical protein
MGRLELLDVVSDEELDLISRLHLEAELPGALHLRLERRALVVGPGRAVDRELAPRCPGEAGLPSQRAQPFGHREQPDVSRRSREPLMGEGDAVMRVEHREQRGHPHPPLGHVHEPVDGHRSRPGNAVVVGPDDRHADHPGALQPLEQRLEAVTVCERPGVRHLD